MKRFTFHTTSKVHVTNYRCLHEDYHQFQACVLFKSMNNCAHLLCGDAAASGCRITIIIYPYQLCDTQIYHKQQTLVFIRIHILILERNSFGVDILHLDMLIHLLFIQIQSAGHNEIFKVASREIWKMDIWKPIQ